MSLVGSRLTSSSDLVRLDLDQVVDRTTDNVYTTAEEDQNIEQMKRSSAALQQQSGPWQRQYEFDALEVLGQGWEDADEIQELSNDRTPDYCADTDPERSLDAAWRAIGRITEQYNKLEGSHERLEKENSLLHDSNRQYVTRLQDLETVRCLGPLSIPFYTNQMCSCTKITCSSGCAWQNNS